MRLFSFCNFKIIFCCSLMISPSSRPRCIYSARQLSISACNSSIILHRPHIDTAHIQHRCTRLSQVLLVVQAVALYLCHNQTCAYTFPSSSTRFTYLALDVTRDPAIRFFFMIGQKPHTVFKFNSGHLSAPLLQFSLRYLDASSLHLPTCRPGRP